MKLKDRIKTYNFWVSLASAVLLIVNTIGKRFNFSLDENLYNDLFTSFCGILVLLGIIVPPTNTKNKNEGFNENSEKETIEEVCTCESSSVFKNNETEHGDIQDNVETIADAEHNKEDISKK